MFGIPNWEPVVVVVDFNAPKFPAVPNVGFVAAVLKTDAVVLAVGVPNEKLGFEPKLKPPPEPNGKPPVVCAKNININYINISINIKGAVSPSAHLVLRIV